MKSEKSPQEVLPDNMILYKGGIFLLFRPNNYRRQIHYQIMDLKNPKTPKETNPIGGSFPMELNKGSKLEYVKNYQGLTLQVGRTKLTAIYSQPLIDGGKEVWKVERNTIQEVQSRITQLKDEIKARLDKALTDFAQERGLKILTKPKWTRYEDWIKGEEYIDNIPPNLVIHDTLFKKVYREGLEFKSSGGNEEPTAHLKNYIKNRAIEDIAPEIAKAIKDLEEAINLKLTQPFNPYKVLFYISIAITTAFIIIGTILMGRS